MFKDHKRCLEQVAIVHQSCSLHGPTTARHYRKVSYSSIAYLFQVILLRALNFLKKGLSSSFKLQ